MENRSFRVTHPFPIVGYSVRLKGTPVRHSLEPFLRTTGALVAGLVFWCAGLVNAADTTINEFPLPTPNSTPRGITASPDGALWFTEINGNKIGRITTTGTITEFPLPAANSFPEVITTGSDGALWFTEFGMNIDKIGKITTGGAITEFTIPTSIRGLIGIAAGPDKALWFTEVNANKIGRITTAGTITEFPIPTPNSQPYSITIGPDGALWFTESNANTIGRITTPGTITEFSLPTPNSGPEAITAGPDGALWFTERGINKIGRITTAGTITQFSLPGIGNFPSALTVGPDGALWFTEKDVNRIGRITTAGAITEFNLPTPNSAPLGITTGPDGALWFTEGGEFTTSKIGQIVLNLVGSTAVSLSGPLFHRDQTLTYEAILTPGLQPTQVDIYLGAILPDGVTFASLIEVSPGVISFALSPSPVPFSANVMFAQTVIPFSYTFNGFEPAGTYVMYAGLVVAGSNPLLPENRLSFAMRSFQFSSDVCLSVAVDAGGSVTVSPQGNNGWPGCFAHFAPGTAVTLTAVPSAGSTFAGWGGDCAPAGTAASCTLVMTTNKHVGASFSTAGSGGSGGYVSGYQCYFFLCDVQLQFQFPPDFQLF